MRRYGRQNAEAERVTGNAPCTPEYYEKLRGWEAARVTSRAEQLAKDDAAAKERLVQKQADAIAKVAGRKEQDVASAVLAEHRAKLLAQSVADAEARRTAAAAAQASHGRRRTRANPNLT